MAEGESSLDNFITQKNVPVPPKKKRLAPVSKLCAKARVSQFPDDFYEEDNILFCKFCQHSVDFFRVDTIKDHLKSKTHAAKKAAGAEKNVPKQKTLTGMIKSKEMRGDFVLDFLKMCTLADIPLHKVEKMQPFLVKHCREGGAVPGSKCLREHHLPKLFTIHFAALKNKLANEYIAVIADETTDCRDHSILNIIAKVRNEAFLIDVVTMAECNHQTLSQACIKAVTSLSLDFNHVQAFVSDSAAYCKKAYRDVLSNIFTSSTHVLCLAHVLNLLGEVFSHWPSLDDVAQLTSFIKSAFFKKPGRKQRYLRWLEQSLPKELVKLPPAPVATRWNSWFNAAKYHAVHFHLYGNFFKAEKSQGMAVERILELVDDSRLHRDAYSKLQMNLHFIDENCNRLMSALTSLEETKSPLACVVYNIMEDMRSYLLSGTTKVSFGTETDRLLSRLDDGEKDQSISDYQELFQSALTKLNKHLDVHPVYDFYKSVRLFDPRQLPCLSHDIDNYRAIKEFQEPSTELVEEFLIYVNFQGDLPENFSIAEFWAANRNRFPLLCQIADRVIWMPVTSVDVERSFSQYKHLLNDRRESLTQENTKQLSMLYFNGDVESRF